MKKVMWIAENGSIIELEPNQLALIEELLLFLQQDTTYCKSSTIPSSTTEIWGRAISRQFFKLRKKNDSFSLSEGEFLEPNVRLWLAELMNFLIYSKGVRQVLQ